MHSVAFAVRAAALCAAVALAACSSWTGGSGDKVPLKGERISVLSLDSALKPDARIRDLEVRLPRPYRNADWSQPGGVPNHANHHLSAEGKLDELWRSNAGSGSSSETQLLAQPVIGDGRVFTLDAAARLSAFDAESGRRLWRVSLTPDHEDEGLRGGGVAFAMGRLFVSTGFAAVVAVDPSDGKEIWRRQVSGPMRAGPTVAGGRVFVVTIANELHALSAEDGRDLWSHTGIAETAGLLGGASPAVDGDVVVVAYSSGELLAIRTDNGRVAWSESLSALRRTDPVSSLAHIKGLPVIDRGRVFAVANSDRMVAIDLRTGGRVWEQGIGGTESPWVAGDFVYLVSNGEELVCLSRQDGRIRWVSPLPKWEDEKDKEGRIRWAGPLLVSDRLIVAGSNREVWSVSPYTGKLLGKLRLPAAVLVAPAVANGTLYFLTEDADLVALR
ncbi:MAG TPA: PQQ-binding-like beta-propeller repeat protein [Alphaproteobacteria bacterium]